jgi:thiol-disulfide isomerase/thioredoxin
MAVLCLFLGVSAQRRMVTNEKVTEVKPILIGDRVPDLVFEQALNLPGGKLKFSDYEGKALILDFWGTWCSACISAFPHSEGIQKKYGKYVQVILINDSRDSLGNTMAFLEERKKNKQEILLPVILTKFTRGLFPHRVYPHYVWIGADRRVKAITDEDQFDEENLQRLIAGFDLNLPVKVK